MLYVTDTVVKNFKNFKNSKTR